MGPGQPLERLSYNIIGYLILFRDGRYARLRLGRIKAEYAGGWGEGESRRTASLVRRFRNSPWRGLNWRIADRIYGNLAICYIRDRYNISRILPYLVSYPEQAFGPNPYTERNRGLVWSRSFSVLDIYRAGGLPFLFADLPAPSCQCLAYGGNVFTAQSESCRE